MSKFIVTVTHNGRKVPLRGTIWAFDMDRAQRFDAREDALRALEDASAFMKRSIYKKAVVEEVAD